MYSPHENWPNTKSIKSSRECTDSGDRGYSFGVHSLVDVRYTHFRFTIHHVNFFTLWTSWGLNHRILLSEEYKYLRHPVLVWYRPDRTETRQYRPWSRPLWLDRLRPPRWNFYLQRECTDRGEPFPRTFRPESTPISDLVDIHRRGPINWRMYLQVIRSFISYLMSLKILSRNLQYTIVRTVTNFVSVRVGVRTVPLHLEWRMTLLIVH